jgi:hypothetical protein
LLFPLCPHVKRFTATTTTRTSTIGRGSFLIVLVVIVVLALPARKAIDDEDEPDQENGGIEPPNGLNKRSTSVNSKQNVQP